MAVTFRADLNVLNLWLDGQHVGYLHVVAHSATGNVLPVEIGRNGPRTSKYWLGEIQDVRIWNRARSGLEISHTYAVPLAGHPAGLIANWHLDEGGGRLAHDTVGGHDGTLGGGSALIVDAYP